MAQQKHCTASQLAIAWVLHQGDDIVPLVGTTKRSRLQEYLGATNIQLSLEELSLLNETFPEGAFAGSRYAREQMGIVVN